MTLEHVARRANVSRATASRVVNGDPRVGEPVRVAVESAVRELQYVPNRAARSLVTRRTDSIAVVVPEPDDRVFSDPFFARTLRGVEQVGGWFLRAEPGLKMIPGEVKDMGITYQADVLSVRPGAPSQHLDASFRVEAGKITSINLAPR